MTIGITRNIEIYRIQYHGLCYSTKKGMAVFVFITMQWIGLSVFINSFNVNWTTYSFFISGLVYKTMSNRCFTYSALSVPVGTRGGFGLSEAW